MFNLTGNQRSYLVRHNAQLRRLGRASKYLSRLFHTLHNNCFTRSRGRRPGRAGCVSKLRDRCGCRVQALVMEGCRNRTPQDIPQITEIYESTPFSGFKQIPRLTKTVRFSFEGLPNLCPVQIPDAKHRQQQQTKPPVPGFSEGRRKGGDLNFHPVPLSLSKEDYLLTFNLGTWIRHLFKEIQRARSGSRRSGQKHGEPNHLVLAARCLGNFASRSGVPWSTHSGQESPE